MDAMAGPAPGQDPDGNQDGTNDGNASGPSSAVTRGARREVGPHRGSSPAAARVDLRVALRLFGAEVQQPEPGQHVPDESPGTQDQLRIGRSGRRRWSLPTVELISGPAVR